MYANQKLIEKIGDFLVTFSAIEKLTYDLLKKLSADDLSEYGASIDRFESRVRFIQALLHDSQ